MPVDKQAFDGSWETGRGRGEEKEDEKNEEDEDEENVDETI